MLPLLLTSGQRIAAYDESGINCRQIKGYVAFQGARQ
jgi:hypothetical protein